MKILLACQQSRHAYPLPAYGFWRTYLTEGLREAGHDVIEVPEADWARGLLPLPAAELARWRDEQWTRTLAAVRASGRIDLFLGYLYPRQIEPSAIRTLQALGLRTVNFFCDNVREFRRLPGEFAPFDLHWVPEHDALPLYAGRGWPALFAPMPCWIPPARRRVLPESDGNVCFIGRRDPLRSALLAGVARAGLPLVLHGSGWNEAAGAPRQPTPSPGWQARIADWTDFYRRQGPGPTWRRFAGRGRDPVPGETFDFGPWTRPAPDEDGYARLTAQSAVTLGINRYPAPFAPAGNTPTYSRLRDIEAPMLGACYLTEWAPELPHLYELGSEIEVYRDETELVEQTRALLADPARRTRLRHAGLRRAQHDHSVGASLQKIARRLSL